MNYNLYRHYNHLHTVYTHIVLHHELAIGQLHIELLARLIESRLFRRRLLQQHVHQRGSAHRWPRVRLDGCRHVFLDGGGRARTRGAALLACCSSSAECAGASEPRRALQWAAT